MASHNASHPSAGPFGAPANFMGVPVEIRLNIYKHIFVRTTDQPLRRLNDIQDYHEPFDTAILRTSPTVYNEAIPEFYASHVFHYTVRPYGPPSQGGIKQSHLSLLQHISMDTTSYSNEHNDVVLANALQLVLENCGALKTLTLHLLVSPSNLPYQISPPWASLTAPLLRTLQPRLDRLSVVTLGKTKSLAWLCAEIDDNADAWVSERLSHWPKMSLSVHQQLSLTCSQRRGAIFLSTPRNQLPVRNTEISAFHIYRKDLVRKMKTGEALGPGDWTVG